MDSYSVDRVDASDPALHELFFHKPFPEPLSAHNSIRLFKLQPHVIGDGDKYNRTPNMSSIWINLEPVLLCTAPKFNIISSAETSGPHDHVLEMGDHEIIPVTEKTYSMLQNLRPDSWDYVQYFWFDQISINQLDEDEKSQQAELMQTIYQQATNSFAALTNGNDRAFEQFLYTIHYLENSPLTQSTKYYMGNAECSKEAVRTIMDNNFKTLLQETIDDDVFDNVYLHGRIGKDKPIILLGGEYQLPLNFFAGVYLTCLRMDRNRPWDPNPFLESVNALLLGESIDNRMKFQIERRNYMYGSITPLPESYEDEFDLTYILNPRPTEAELYIASLLR